MVKGVLYLDDREHLDVIGPLHAPKAAGANLDPGVHARSMALDALGEQLSLRARYYVGDDRNIMEDTAAEDEKVKDSVMMLDAVPAEEDQAEGIADAARRDQ